MLERLLAQKTFKICGPKRRETIKNGEKIKIMVNEILKENKDSIKNCQINRKNSIVLKNKKEKREVKEEKEPNAEEKKENIEEKKENDDNKEENKEEKII